ncbi:MAG: polysaccharide deacetylase family protein [Clostridia bacterium]|nr:polysaccharide deacetylase family protein [Clostridia bacterium]
MYVVKMKTLISFFAAFAVAIASIGIVRLYSTAEPAVHTADVSSEIDSSSEETLSAASKKGKIEVPILMYHSILRSTNTHGNYIISESAFESDLKFLKDNGYTTIFIGDLIDYVEGGKELPQKPVILTFDDGYYNNYLYAFPLLKKYNSKAVLSIIGYYTDLYTETPDENPSYSHVTWGNVKDMLSSGLVELQNHSYNLHTTDKGRNGSKKKRGESDTEYRALLTSDLGKLQNSFKTNVNYTPTTYTYPFGSVSNASFDIIKEMGFKASLSCESGMNYITRDPECLYMMKRYLRTPKKSAETLLK